MFRKIHSDEEQLSREQLEADFSAAYTAHGGEILKYLLSSGMQTADAQDVLQNSFLAMWELRFRIEDTKNLAPLWFTIARHKMFDLFRSSRRRWFPFTGEEQNIPAPEGGCGNRINNICGGGSPRRWPDCRKRWPRRTG